MYPPVKAWGFLPDAQGVRRMTLNLADRLTEAVAAKGAPAVVALDPVFGRLPAALRAGHGGGEPVDTETVMEAIWEFGWRVLEVIAPVAPVVKINSAYFERYHARGIETYDNLVEEALGRGLIVIGDVKRGDVGHTAEMYALAQLAEPPTAEAETRVAPDAVTVNGYFGLDGIKPFIQVATREGKGIFVLVRTSNPSAAVIQDAMTQDGRKVHEVVAAEVARWAEDSETIGECGYSGIGAVTATRDPADAARLRAAMPKSILLVPGYGAQGGRAEDFAPYFDAKGGGALIVAGRSVIYAHEMEANQAAHGSDWQRCIEQACRDFVTDIARVTSHPGTAG